MKLLLSLFTVLAAVAEAASPFEPDYTNRLLGEAYKTPDGIVWGDIHSPNDVRYMDFESAKKYCAHIGAELPKGSDFAALRQYVATAKGSRVAPSDWNNYLPNLTYSCRMTEYFYRGDPRHYNGHCSWEFWTAAEF